jgi:pimeloyl-ACP methyl ester carboxylesterase
VTAPASPSGPHHTLSVGNATIAYRHVSGRNPGIVFLGGFMSDMNGSKATALAAWTAEKGHAFTRFDYQGHGVSGGRFEDGTIGSWTRDALAVIDRVTEGPLILVGSSMGGWISLLAALARPERVTALVAIAAATDFTQDLIWDRIGADAQRRILDDGVWPMPEEGGGRPEPITRTLIEEGREHLLLRAPIPLTIPIRLVHGVEDRTVPWDRSLRLMERLTGADVRLTFVKDGDHRLSRPPDLALLTSVVGEVLESVAVMEQSP